jgi:hypothetical protein
MPGSLDAGVVEAVAIGKLKSISEQPAMLSNLAFFQHDYQYKSFCPEFSCQSTGNQRTWRFHPGRIVNVVANLGPLESKSAQEILTGSTMGELISNLKAATENLNAATRR